MTKLLTKHFAFTLAEVLITMTIIGVVAALTVPTMIQNYQEKATVAKLRTVYSTLNQAFYMAKTDKGSPETWDWGTAWDGPSAVKVFNEYFFYVEYMIKNFSNAILYGTNYLSVFEMHKFTEKVELSIYSCILVLKNQYKFSFLNNQK